MTTYWIRIERLNEDTGEIDKLKTITLIEQNGKLQTSARIFSMMESDALGLLAVQLPGDSVYALAANAWQKYDYIMKMKEKERHGTDRKE
jgi:tRNA A37 threonylcarbamoyladenosine synthetase subunit TsaC/SUA5/YrdC